MLTLAALVMAPFAGSFIGTVIDRLPTGRSIVFGRSRCDSCGLALAARDLFPLFSWLLSRGRCRRCTAPLDLFYPAVELAAVIVALSATVPQPGSPAELGQSLALGWMLLAIGWIDARHMMIPDTLSLPLLGLGLLGAAKLAPESLADRALGAALGYTMFTLVALTYRRLRQRDGLGGGDAKLLAAGGAWVGWQGLPTVVLVAALAGIGMALLAARSGRTLRPETAIPFAPALALGTWLVWRFGPVAF